MSGDRPLWLAPVPLWAAAREGRLSVDRPVVLRFASDDFMTEVQTALATGAGAGLADHVVAAETWREPRAGLAAAASDRDAERPPPALYQPPHGRFYLVASNLVCERYWLPDKRIDTTLEQSAFFVLRRFEPRPAGGPIDLDDPGTHRELGWTTSGSAGAWQPVSPGTLAAGEERLPLFAVSFPAEDGGRRRLMAGLVPVSAGEAYGAAPLRLPSAGGPGTGTDPMGALTDARLGPLSAVVDGMQATRQLAAQSAVTLRPGAALLQESLYFLVLDLAEVLKRELPRVWNNASGLSAAERELADTLRAAHGFRGNTSWDAALKAAVVAGPLASAGGATPALVAGMSATAVAAAIAKLPVEAVAGAGHLDPARTSFFLAVAAALPARGGTGSSGTTPGTGTGGRSRSVDPGARTRYALRCVYERPRCPEPIRLALSRPTEPFTLAPFFDPDAPFRPVRIPTPVDTSLAGLRRHPKGVTVAISRQLRQQMERVQGAKLSDLDSGSVPDGGGVSFGMVCQLSIPIITIVALLLLMIIVQLLNIVFFWVPLFKICLPSVEES